MATKSPLEPREKYEITEELPPLPLKELHRYIKDRYPQCVQALRGSLIATPAKNAKPGVIVPGEVFIILSSKIVPCMNIRWVGDKLIPVPITSKTKFALIPNDDRDSERILDKDWEGTFTDVSEILQLPILPLALYVQSDFNDHKKQKLSRGDILYNIKVFKAGKLKTRRGIQGVSSDGTTYTFLEAEPVDFSSKQIDTKTTLYWFLKVVQFPQRARVFARGTCDIPGISNHSEVTFTDRGSDELLVDNVKKLGDDPSSFMYINVNSDVKVAAVKLKDCKEYDIVMERRQFCIQTSCPSSQTLPKENEYENPRLLVTEPRETSHPYENYTPRNERDYYNILDRNPSQTPDKQGSRPQLVCGDSKEGPYPALDNKLHNNTEMSNYPLREEKKPSAYSKPGCESKQASGLHQPTSVAKPSLSDRPSDIHLRHYVTDKIGKDLGRLATYLELDYSCVEQIKQDLDNAEEQCFRVLIEWLRGKGAEPKTWEVLLKKLDSSGRKDISGEIREKIENGKLDDF